MLIDSNPSPLDSPSPAEVADWLREHVKKKPPGRIARWLGEPLEFAYELSRLYSVQMKCITRQTLVAFGGEDGLLPYPALPGGSWGIFAIHNQELYLPEPSTESLSALLAREGTSLDDADPEDLAELICLILRNGPGDRQHDLVRSPDQLRCYRWEGLDGYRVDESTLQSVAKAIVAPSLRGSATQGWNLESVTVEGWMHQKDHLGVERYEISPAFNVARLTRVVLHERNFTETPSVIY